MKKLEEVLKEYTDTEAEEENPSSRKYGNKTGLLIPNEVFMTIMQKAMEEQRTREILRILRESGD